MLAAGIAASGLMTLIDGFELDMPPLLRPVIASSAIDSSRSYAV